MRKVFFVRHAESNYENPNDRLRELTEKGLKDRHKLISFFREVDIDWIFSSPYRRALDTILPCAERAGRDIITCDKFKERKISDTWIEDFDSFARKQWSDFNYKLERGESLAEVQERCVNGLRDILANYKGDHIIIGGHGTAISSIINYFDGSFSYEDFETLRYEMPFILELKFDYDNEFKDYRVIKL